MFFAPILHVLFGELWSKGINTQGWFPGRLDVHQWVSPNAPLLRGPSRAYAELLGHRCVAVWIGTAHGLPPHRCSGIPRSVSRNHSQTRSLGFGPLMFLASSLRSSLAHSRHFQGQIGSSRRVCNLTRAQRVSARIIAAQTLSNQQKLREVSVQKTMKRRIALRLQLSHNYLTRGLSVLRRSSGKTSNSNRWESPTSA